MRVTRGDLALPGAGRVIDGEGWTAHHRDSVGHLELAPIVSGGRLVFVLWADAWNRDGSAHFRIALKEDDAAE